MSNDITARQAVTLQAAQTQQSASQVGIKAVIEKDQQIVGMLQKAQDQLQSVTPTRGNSVNLKA